MATDEQIRELVEKMHEERARLFASLSGISDERASQANPEKDGEDGWSVKEILAHLAMMDGLYRGWAHRAATEDRPDLRTPDPNRPPAEGHYLDGVNDRSVLSLIQEMERQRAITMEFIASLKPEEFDRTAITALFGELSAIQLLRSYYRHDRQHAAQIEGRESEYKPRFTSGVEPDQRRK